MLVVEDSTVQRAHAVSLAAELGAEHILEAADGVEGLSALAESGTVDLVLSDLEMPRMEGVTFIGELAARGYRPRVIIISSLGPEVMRAVRLMAETYGLAVPGVIPKPLTLASLKQVISARSNAGPPFPDHRGGPGGPFGGGNPAGHRGQGILLLLPAAGHPAGRGLPGRRGPGPLAAWPVRTPRAGRVPAPG